jgi:hypothetical protein
LGSGNVRKQGYLSDGNFAGITRNFNVTGGLFGRIRAEMRGIGRQTTSRSGAKVN